MNAYNASLGLGLITDANDTNILHLVELVLELQEKDKGTLTDEEALFVDYIKNVKTESFLMVN